ncbi:hypothetical protein HanPI659440_Chr03g0112431 [Helianthus annuus]|nr:hypothetical protein HanPI659440_Chr03g0112431 [Helianthus annuus]
MGVHYVFCKTEHVKQKMDSETKLSVSVCQIFFKMVLNFRGSKRNCQKIQKH